MTNTDGRPSSQVNNSFNTYKQPINTYKQSIKTYKQPINNLLTHILSLWPSSQGHKSGRNCWM